jgi:hypothetical protein
MTETILTPILALVGWTLFMWIWMYATRLPAMSKAGIEPQAAAHKGALDGLPSSVRGIGDNYNHLHEQPTVFYALVIYSHLAGTGDALMIQLAWGYVGIRILHSLVQSTINKVMIRFSLFCLSSIVLIIMAVRSAMALM